MITKPVGSINKKAVAREKRSAERFRRKLERPRQPKQRSLQELEDEVERLLMKEALVLLSQEFVDRLHNHFMQLLSEEEEQDEKVDLSNLIDAIAEDDFF